MQEDSVYLELLKIIREITVWDKQYIGKVISNTDDLQKGRVKVTVSMLGFDTSEKAITCFPKDKNQLSVPEVNDYVTIGFLNGDPKLSYYDGVANNINLMLPNNYDGLPTTHILFEDPKVRDNYIKVNSLLSTLTIMMGGFIELNGNADFAVAFTDLKSAFDQLRTELNTFISTYNGHTHTGPFTGSTSTPSAPGVTSTADMSSAKVDTVKLP